MTPDTKVAQQYFKENRAVDGRFSQYSAAYPITNEDLRLSLSDAMPKNTENALVCAGSGDHPIFTALYGAKNIDAFDISYNAKCLMNIKTNAIQILNYKDYCDLIMFLYFAVDVVNAPGMDKIMPNLSKEEQSYLGDMRMYNIFGRGITPFAYEKHLPSESEYNKLRENIKQPFNFIWSNITTLRNKLDKTYNFMHLSNILDYYIDDDDRAYVLVPLMRHVRSKGVICFETYRNIPESLVKHCEYLKEKQSQEWVFLHHKKDSFIHVMQRIK